MSEKFQAQIVPLGEQPSFPNVQEVRPGEKIRNQYAGILIKKNGLLGPVYYLNKRPGKEDDRVYENRTGLFAGKRDQDIDESYEDAALRELKEETGIKRDAIELKHLAQVHSWDDKLNANIGYIFLKHYGIMHRKVSLSRIREHIKKDNVQAEKEGRNKIGKAVRIRRLFWTFYTEWWIVPVNWARYTPELVYALVRDYDRDIGRRMWHNW